MVGYAGGSRRQGNHRWKANSRERSRMHCLNSAMDRLRELVPVDATLFPGAGGIAPPKLSKIETLRLAINYMEALQTTLQQGKIPDQATYCRQMSKGLSEQTGQLIAASLRLRYFVNSSTENGISNHSHYDESVSTTYPGVFRDDISNCGHHRKIPDQDITPPSPRHAHWSCAEGKQCIYTADLSMRDYYTNSGYQLFY